MGDTGSGSQGAVSTRVLWWAPKGEAAEALVPRVVGTVSGRGNAVSGAHERGGGNRKSRRSDRAIE